MFRVKKPVSVNIERYSVYDDVVIYFLKFRNSTTNEEWTYKQRYSELRAIHDALLNQGLKNKLPPFPQRKLFGITNEDPESIEKRREELQQYLNGLFSLEEVYNNQVIQFLITDSKRDFEKNKQLEERKRLSKTAKGDLNQKIPDLSQSPTDQTKQKSTSQQVQSNNFEDYLHEEKKSLDDLQKQTK